MAYFPHRLSTVQEKGRPQIQRDQCIVFLNRGRIHDPQLLRFSVHCTATLSSALRFISLAR